MRKLVTLFALACVAAAAADVSGTWSFAVETGSGSGNPTFVFKQNGEKLTGKYSGLFGTADVAGTVKGDRIEFQFEASYDGNKLTIKYSGAVESETRMKGKVEVPGLGEGTWTAEKKQG